jgi:hypothetical protein
VFGRGAGDDLRFELLGSWLVVAELDDGLLGVHWCTLGILAESGGVLKKKEKKTAQKKGKMT